MDALAAPRRALPSGLNCAGPSVSIIIPAHNAADTIDHALTSVAAQKRAAWEAIVVDDGSTDATAAIVEGWTRRDGRVRLIRQPQRGVSAARNAGIWSAKADWLCFLDADDWLETRALARLLALARAAPDACVVVGAAARVSQDGRIWTYGSRDLSDPFLVLSAHCAYPIHSALVRRTVVQDLGGFDESLRSSEDWDLWQRIARAGGRFVRTRARVALYRARPGSLSRNLPQSAEQGLLVMRRAHAPDPRVPRAEPRYAAGAPPDALPTHELYYVLWSAARDIAAGGDGLATAALLEDASDVDFEPGAMGDLMASGMADMLARRPDELRAHWPTFEPKLHRVLELVYPDHARDRLKRLTLSTIKARLNGGSAGDDDVLQVDAPSLPPAWQTGRDFCVLQLRFKHSTLGAVAMPLLGAATGVDLLEAVTQQVRRLPLKAALAAFRPWRRLSFWKAAGLALVDVRGMGLRRALRRRRLVREIFRIRLRQALQAGLQQALSAALRPLARLGGDSGHVRARDLLQRELAVSTAPAVHDSTEEPGGPGRAAEPGCAGSWDEFYEAEDPWNYRGSDYERLKYQDTLELIPPAPGACALEVGCAEGHFTARLAGRVHALLATDISVKALERAARRCKHLDNVRFQPLDVVKQRLPGRYDLIVCSEMLYYTGAHLGAVAEKLAAALRPGGLIVMANANQIADEPDVTGFDWGHDYGARTISETFAALPGLYLEREIFRPLYRVQAFRRRGDRHAEPAPIVEHRPLEVALKPAVARHVVWGGGGSRITALRGELAVRTPILMYHRIAPEGSHGAALDRYRVSPERFAEQMAYLRRKGCWGVGPNELAEALASNRPLPGRPVMITFDDGYADFAEHAWPVLQKHDLRAIVFVVAAKVGGAADWDAQHGAPAPLMSWRELSDLAKAGLYVESHGHTHRGLTRVDVREIYRELLSSRALIEQMIARRPSCICYPFGAVDAVVARVAEECGFTLGFGTSPGLADLADDPLRLPRVEVSVNDDLESFARKLGFD